MAAGIEDAPFVNVFGDIISSLFEDWASIPHSYGKKRLTEHGKIIEAITKNHGIMRIGMQQGHHFLNPLPLINRFHKIGIVDKR